MTDGLAPEVLYEVAPTEVTFLLAYIQVLDGTGVNKSELYSTTCLVDKAQAQFSLTKFT